MEAQNENAEGVDPPASLEIISWSEAKARGLKRYYTGMSCKYGHVAQRLVLNKRCCKCHAEREHRRRAANPDKAKESDRHWRAGNLERYRERARRYYAADPDKIRERNRRYRAADPDKIRKQKRESERRRRVTNPDKVREQDRRRRTDPIYKLVHSQYKRVRKALSRTRKSKRTMYLVGCTPQFLYEHISRQLVGTDFTMENYGTVWHIDHIRPLASFDLSSEREQLMAFNWLNLRPLRGSENLRKRAIPPTSSELHEHYTKLLGPGDFWQSIRPKPAKSILDHSDGPGVLYTYL